MEPHVERMLKEQEELGLKIKKLRVFINNNPIYQELPEDEQNDMTEQYTCMKAYFAVLSRRIKRANNE